jgi:hyperosmotically inducible periplasmic protein
MKKMLKIGFGLVVLFFALSLTSCKPKDADVQSAIEKVLKADADMSSTMVVVKDGVATLSGECKDEMCKAKCEAAVKAVKGVKEIVNNCSITPPPAPEPIPEVAVVDPLTQSVADALKDFPTVKSELKDGVLTLTGEIERSNLQKMMMGLQSLKAMGVKKIESTGLVKK